MHYCPADTTICDVWVNKGTSQCFIDTKMRYCPANTTIFGKWLNNRSQCFMDTTIYSILSVYLLIFGVYKLWLYKKYGTLLSPDILSRSKLYYVQLFFTYFLSILAVTKFFVQMKFTYHGEILGFAVSVPVDGKLISRTYTGCSFKIGHFT